jgi:hypothetical protein
VVAYFFGAAHAHLGNEHKDVFTGVGHGGG